MAFLSESFMGMIPNFFGSLPFGVDLVLRILVAGICGFIIGFERKTRSKEAGIRTHTLVAIGSALFMLISKYGFADLDAAGKGIMGITGADASRVVSQAVTGIGFLGGGVIVYTKGSLHGLTTAAGIWATAAVGMMVGSGVGSLMVLGVVCALLIVGVHLFFRLPVKGFRSKVLHTVTIVFDAQDGAIDKIKGLFGTCKVAKMKMTETDFGVLGEMVIRTSDNLEDSVWRKTISEVDFIRSIEYNEEEI